MEQTTIIPSPTTYLPMVVEASEQTTTIGATCQALKDYYRSEQIDGPQIRVSQIISG